MPTTTIDTMRTQLGALFQAYNDHDLDAILTLFTDDIVWDDPNLPAPAIGKEATGEVIRGQFTAMPDLHFPKEEIMIFTSPHGGAASRWHAVGTMTGRLDPPGYLPTGKTADWSGMCYYEFRGGLIARHVLVYDVLGLTQRLGLMPATDSLMTKTLVSAHNVGSRLATVFRH
jgi:hypothetical protein